MEQLQPVKTKSSRLKEFFYQTFRPHSKAEYAEFFVRGIKREDGDGEYKAYPFVYMRVFVLLALLFGLTAGVLFFTENTITYPLVTVLGGLLVNVPFVVFIYELYPMKNISLPHLAAVMLFGGIASTLLINLAYWFYEPADEIIDVFYVGLVEEFFKALPCFLLITLNKNRTPFYGLLVGIAVGAGMATGEDIGYIFIYSSNSIFGLSHYMDYYELVSITVVRGITAGCTHIVWTGLIGYAFAKYKKPLSCPQFYLMFAGCVLLHSMWDMPAEIIGYVMLGLIYFVCAVVAITLVIRAVLRERRLIKEALRPEIPDIGIAEMLSEVASSDSQPVPKKLVFANALMGICTFVIAVCGMLICYLGDGWFVYEKIKFAGSEAMLEYVQDGKIFDVNPDREYNPSVKDYECSYREEKLVSATQCVHGFLYDVYYEYNFETSPKPESVWVDYDGRAYYVGWVESEDGAIAYIPLNPMFYEVVYNGDGTYTVETENFLFSGEVKLLVLLGVALAAVIGVACCASIITKDKIRQAKIAEAAEIFDYNGEDKNVE